MENKKEVVAPGKEESISLKENKVLPGSENKKKKPTNISLQKLDLGTKPINIAYSNNFLNINDIINFIKTRIKTFLIVVVVIVVFVVLFSLKSIIFRQADDDIPEAEEIKVPENKTASLFEKNNTQSSSSSSGK